ncbi:hypothetical protein HGRIS_003686 [Hohenbuehelia grisea]|uniref:Uncharacterized protein n=1 Tax=Hohenbuehelia grisea TaxID=104357 RepID=A0ABR3JH39_9AGAR
MDIWVRILEDADMQTMVPLLSAPGTRLLVQRELRLRAKKSLLVFLAVGETPEFWAVIARTQSAIVGQLAVEIATGTNRAEERTMDIIVPRGGLQILLVYFGAAEYEEVDREIGVAYSIRRRVTMRKAQVSRIAVEKMYVSDARRRNK